MKNEKTYTLILTSLFAAITILMAFTPLGYIPLVIINATIIHIPVILGSLFLGPKRGAFLGFVFGATSFINNTFRAATASAFVFSPVLAYNMVGVSGIFKSLYICFVPRILVGVVPYFVFIGVKHLLKNAPKISSYIAFIFAGMFGAFTNTALVMSGIYFLYKDAYAEAIGVAGDAVIGVIMGVVSFNGVIEAIVAAIIVVAVGTALTVVHPTYTKMRTGEARSVA